MNDALPIERSSAWFLPGLVFCVAWLPLAALYAWHVATWRAQAGWTPVEATVESVTVRRATFTTQNECSVGPPWAVVVTYAWEHSGRRHQGSRYDYDQDGEYFCNEDDAKRKAARVEQKRTVRAFVDPSASHQAVLALPDESGVALGGVGLVIFAGALVGFGVRASRKAKSKSAEWE